MTTGIPETTRKRFKKKVNWLRWRKAVMPCYYNCPHEYVVRDATYSFRGHRGAAPEKDFQFFKKTIRTHGERRNGGIGATSCCSMVALFIGRSRPIINRTDRRSMIEWRTPASEGSGANAEKVLADYSRPEAV